MSWNPPWRSRHLGALEIEELPPFMIRIVGVDRNEVDRVTRLVEDAARNSGARYHYLQKQEGTTKRETSGSYTTNLTKPEIRKYGFPSEFYGKMTFWRNIIVSNPQGETFAALAQIKPGALVRVAIE
jgi:ribosomal protein S10